MLKILVPTDFSDCSKQAFIFAVNLIEEHSGELLVMHATDSPIRNDVFNPTDAGSYPTTLAKYMNEKLENEMAIFIKGKEKHTKTVVENGEITKLINHRVKNEGYNMVVVGSHGLSTLKEVFVGSTTEKIIRTANCPVFSIHKKVNPGSIKNIVFASDYKVIAPELIKELKRLQSLFAATIHFVKINTPTHFERDVTVNQRAKKFIRQHQFTNYTYEVYCEFTTEEGIVRYANSIDADLIALGTHGHQGLRHLALGSVAENVANHTWNAVWTYKFPKQPGSNSLSRIGQALDISYS